MIARLEGKLVECTEDSVVLNVNDVFYELFVPKSIRMAMESKSPGESVQLVTYHYLQSDPSKAIPVLVGFNNPIEREFFEKFITVSGIGPKGALRALSVPISQIAQAIDAADIAFLKTLPGVGEQRAREIIAKLQGKVGRFALIQDGAYPPEQGQAESDVKEEALAVLLQLQYKREEAKRMIEFALRQNRSIRSVEDLLNEVYRQRSVETASL